MEQWKVVMAFSLHTYVLWIGTEVLKNRANKKRR